MSATYLRGTQRHAAAGVSRGMMLTPNELLDFLDQSGATIRLMEDGSLDCQNVPEHLVSEIHRHATNGVLPAILSGFCNQPIPAKIPEKPKRRSSGKPRRGCKVCKSGHGCRKRGEREWQSCPECGHPCRSHYLEQMTWLFDDKRWFLCPGGCAYRRDCDCPGWPLEEKKPRKTKAKRV